MGSHLSYQLKDTARLHSTWHELTTFVQAHQIRPVVGTTFSFDDRFKVSVLDCDITNSSIGVIIPRSCLWRDTSAITSIELKSVGGAYNFVEYSHFALYGIRG